MEQCDHDHNEAYLADIADRRPETEGYRMYRMPAEARYAHLTTLPDHVASAAQLELLPRLSPDERAEYLIAGISREDREAFFHTMTRKQRALEECSMLAWMSHEQAQGYLESLGKNRADVEAAMLEEMPAGGRMEYLGG